MHSGVLINFNPEGQIRLVEADIGVCILARRDEGEGEERALGHGGEGVRAPVARGAGAEGPCCWVGLGAQVWDCCAVAVFSIRVWLESKSLDGVFV